MGYYTVIKQAANFERKFSLDEFINWYQTSPVMGLEPFPDLISNVKSEKYSNGYYIGMGYIVKFSNTTEKAEEPVKIETKCLHSRKYLNKISITLQFMVCPDCKQEVKEEPKTYNNDWWVGV